MVHGPHLVLFSKLRILKEACVRGIRMTTCDRLSLISPQLVLIACFLMRLFKAHSPSTAFTTENQH